VLAQLLPGVRDLRAPLTAGYLWLTLIWLVWHAQIESLLDNPPLNNLKELPPTTRSFGAVITLSVVAYLCGSLVNALLKPALALLWGIIGRRMRPEFPDVPDAGERLTRRAFGGQREYYIRLSPEGRRLLNEWAEDKTREHRFGNPWPPIDDAPPLSYLVASQLDLVKLQLLSVSPDLHAQVDRKDSEAEFRGMLSLPLFLLGWWLAIADGWGWMVVIVVAAALAEHGFVLRREAATDLVLAMRARGIEPPALAELTPQPAD
jgi:hypothetical protein